MHWLFQVHFFCPSQLLFCRKHGFSCFFILFWTEKCWNPWMVFWISLGSNCCYYFWCQAWEMKWWGGIRGVRKTKPWLCKGTGLRQGWAGLDETLAQRRCLVRWSLGSESPWCLSPGLGKSCFIHIIPLSPRYMLLVSVSHNGFNKDNLANVLSRVLFLLGFSNGLVSASQPVTGYQIKQAKVFA